MSILTYKDGSFPIKDNDIIFAEGQSCQSINILLQGKVDVYLCFNDKCSTLNEVEIARNSFKLFTIEKGNVLGCEGLFDEGMQYFTFKSSEDSNVFVFCTPTIAKMQSMIEAHSEYGAYIITSIANTIYNCAEVYTKVRKVKKELQILTDNLTSFYWHYKELFSFENSGLGQNFMDGLENYENLKEKNILPPSEFSEEFFTTTINTEAALEEETFSLEESSEVIYYKRFLSMPLSVRKNFFGSDFIVTSYHCRKGIQYLNELNGELRESFKTIYNLYNMLCSKGNEGILIQYAKAASKLNMNSKSTQDFLKLLSFIETKAQYYINYFKSEFNNDCGMDSEYLRGVVNKVILGVDPFDEALANSDSKTGANIYFDSIPDELQDSARKIIEYSKIDEDSAKIFFTNLNAFRKMNDKFAVDDTAYSIRKNITQIYFKIYEGVMKRVMTENPQTRLYHMFLNFGYMDEQLLLPEQTLSLYNAVDKFSSHGDNQIYCMRDWLIDIYELKKDPSMNDFSMDYNDVFRDMKKRGEITDKDKQRYMADKDGRLNFEINNMFKSNHRVCYGQPSTYFPIIHKDIFVRDLDKALITPEKVTESLNRILEIDYSAFHREINYKNDITGIEKELVMLKIMPDIILMPTFGSRGIMWQEISGRNRSTPGRFILPIMTAENLDDILVKLVGNFRWELCRTMMGVAWNDITQKSLTSEYTDYIQFYKKNRDLTEDNKEKIAQQMVKYRGLMREIFTADYELWINYESKGVIRLNKISRSILYRYCPFNREIRDNLSKHPLFSDHDSRYRILRSKMIRELDNHYKKLQRSGLVLDEALADNLKFYKEM